MPDYSALRQELEKLVARAGKIAQNARSKDFRRELKPDGSIVTDGDQEVEEFLDAELARLLPGTNVWGEESGFNSCGDAGLWLVDPIDGTSNYSFGSPLWGVSVALLVGDAIEVGVVHLPDVGELYSAHRGGGTTQNGRALAPIPPGPILSHELLSFNEGLLKLAHWPGKMRHTGSFVIDAAWVATQRFRGLADNRCKLYDIAASVLLCTELGADFRYADGRPVDLRDLAVDEKVPAPIVLFPRESGFVMKLR